MYKILRTSRREQFYRMHLQKEFSTSNWMTTYNFIILFEDSIFLVSILGLCNSSVIQLSLLGLCKLREGTETFLIGHAVAGKIQDAVKLNVFGFFCVLPKIITFPIIETLWTLGYLRVIFYEQIIVWGNN